MQTLWAIISSDNVFVNTVLWNGDLSVWPLPENTQAIEIDEFWANTGVNPRPDDFEPSDFMQGGRRSKSFTPTSPFAQLYAVINTAGGYLVNVVRWDGVSAWSPPDGTTVVLASTVDFATLPPPP